MILIEISDWIGWSLKLVRSGWTHSFVCLPIFIIPKKEKEENEEKWNWKSRSESAKLTFSYWGDSNQWCEAKFQSNDGPFGHPDGHYNLFDSILSPLSASHLHVYFEKRILFSVPGKMDAVQPSATSEMEWRKSSQPTLWLAVFLRQQWREAGEGVRMKMKTRACFGVGRQVGQRLFGNGGAMASTKRKYKEREGEVFQVLRRRRWKYVSRKCDEMK